MEQKYVLHIRKCNKTAHYNRGRGQVFCWRHAGRMSFANLLNIRVTKYWKLNSAVELFESLPSISIQDIQVFTHPYQLLIQILVSYWCHRFVKRIFVLRLVLRFHEYTLKTRNLSAIQGSAHLATMFQTNSWGLIFFHHISYMILAASEGIGVTHLDLSICLQEVVPCSDVLTYVEARDAQGSCLCIFFSYFYSIFYFGIVSLLTCAWSHFSTCFHPYNVNFQYVLSVHARSLINFTACGQCSYICSALSHVVNI